MVLHGCEIVEMIRVSSVGSHGAQSDHDMSNPRQFVAPSIGDVFGLHLDVELDLKLASGSEKWLKKEYPYQGETSELYGLE